MNIADMTPAEIDTILADNWNKQARHSSYATFYRKEVERDERRGMTATLNQEHLAKHLDAIDVLTAEAAPFTQEFHARGRWNRYYLVNNSGGHVHREMECTTCYITTEFMWVTTLSDCDEQAMVAEYGEMACTVCFPDAPAMKGYADGSSALARYSAEAKAERAKAKAERAAAKAAKELAEPLEVTNGWTNWQGRVFYDRVTTIAAAKRWIKDAIDNRIIYGYHTYDTPETFSSIAILTGALNARGVDADALVAKWTAAATKKAAA